MVEVTEPAAAGARRTPWVVVAGLVALGIAVLYGLRVREYWFLSDDAFISFRYSRHLADGLGLVWNAGEPVEGYTNFLWVLLMAASLSLGLEPESTQRKLV